MTFARGVAIGVLVAGAGLSCLAVAQGAQPRSAPCAAPDRPMRWATLMQLQAGIETMAQADDGKDRTEREAAQAGPVISPPTVRKSQPVPQGKRLDDPTLEQSPVWKPGDPERIMPDLRRSDEPTQRNDPK